MHRLLTQTLHYSEGLYIKKYFVHHARKFRLGKIMLKQDCSEHYIPNSFFLSMNLLGRVYKNSILLQKHPSVNVYHGTIVKL